MRGNGMSAEDLLLQGTEWMRRCLHEFGRFGSRSADDTGQGRGSVVRQTSAASGSFKS